MSEKNETNNRRSFLLALPFLIALAVLTVISFCIPLRPTISTSEKRELTKFPEFTLESLLSGDYFDDITLWFSDTFPGREDWLSLSQSVSSFHGYSEIAVQGDLTMSDDIPVEEPSEPVTQPSPSRAVHSTVRQTLSRAEKRSERWSVKAFSGERAPVMSV